MPDMTGSSGGPGVDAVVEAGTQTLRVFASLARWSERQVLGLLESRLEAVARPAPVASLPGGRVHTEGLNAKLGRLLRQAVDQSTASGQNELFHKLLDQLVPDEARIMAALSDGSSSPVVTVLRRGRAGSAGEIVLENMSLVGKTANLALASQVPTYVSHLLALGLVELGPHDPNMDIDFEILCADPAVLRAIKIASRGPVSARIEKHVLRLSGLGMSLWATASGDEPQ